MSKIFEDSSPLVKQPHSEYWDAPLTRREAQRAINKLAQNDSELMGMADTAALVINFLCEEGKFKREDIEAYVAKKIIEVKAMRAAAKAQVGEVQGGQTQDAQSNS